MATDILGNKLKVGQKVIWNGMVCTIKSIDENRLLGGGKFIAKGIQGMKIPDNITIEIDLPFDAEKPFNGAVCQEPPNNEGQSN